MTNPNIKSIYNRYEKSKISEQTKIREILQQTALLGLERIVSLASLTRYVFFCPSFFSFISTFLSMSLYREFIIGDNVTFSLLDIKAGTALLPSIYTPSQMASSPVNGTNA